MESFDNFMELFKRRKKERNNSDLADILKNAPSYFRNLSTNEIDLALSVFINDKTGLLHFLTDTSDKTMENSIIEGFKILNFIIQQFYWLLDQYLIRIKKVCQSGIIRKSSQFVKAASADCFETLIKMCPGDELRLNETVQLLVARFHVCTDTERTKFFKALGSIAKYHPEAILTGHAKTIFERVMNDFERSYSKSKPGSQPGELAIYFEVLNNLLENFFTQQSSDRSEHYKKLYRCIKELSNIDSNQQLKFVSRAGIALLGKHVSKFTDYIYEDALYWHNTLLRWTQFKGENGIVAFNTLSVYYKQMGSILQNRSTEIDRAIFERFMQYFKNEFTNDNVDSITLQLSIRGFGHMAGACRIHLDENNVVQMFSLIARKTTIMYTNNNEMNGTIENIAYYQEALSEILLHVSEVSSDQLTALSTLCLILIKRFPELPITRHSLAVISLMRTLCNIRKACRRSHEAFIQRLVYEGIIWSCSHTLFIDAEAERELKNLNERPICYKNYLPLWEPLVSRNQITNIDESSTISIQILKNLIETCVRLIKKLNLDVQTDGMDSSCGTEDLDTPIAVNDTDFRVFINLVDLFVDILQKLEPDVIESKMNWFFCEMIKKSNKNPLISGFYKLIRSVLKLYNLSFEACERNLLHETSGLLFKYLSDTIDRLSSFSGELQNSCFTMIFQMPISMAESLLDRLIPVFKTAFSLGQSNIDVSESALSTLEKWSRTMRKGTMKNFLIRVVPSLESLLQSSESAVDLTQDFVTPNEQRKVIKNIVLADNKKTLEAFQRRILLFFGSLNSYVTSNLATERRSCVDAALGNDNNLLKYTLLYKDIKPDIYLDKILLRTIELALNSTDRRTRVLACEVLHTIIIVMLGRTVQFLSSNPDRLLPIFKRICPVILRLGSDSDQIIQQLFHPLTIQLTHWYSSKMMLQSSETVYLIEVLFDLLTYESNVALNDFCGVCLAEFVKWSIKQSTNADKQTPLTNVAAIINKIKNFALHPSVQKRIGAAVAFNYLYMILREDNVIVDIFWMELLFCFMKSLDGCSDTRIFKSLKHIERVIDNRYELLNKGSSQRKKPAEFNGILLKDAVDWLFVQCGSLDQNFRSKSMKVLERISKHVPEYGSVEKVFENYLNINSVRGLNDIILKNLRPKIDNLSLETMKPILRTLDCYIWIIDDNIINLELLFTDKNANKDMIFNCISNFVYIINVKRENDDENSTEFTTQSQFDVRLLKCKIILRIFHFVKILLNRTETGGDANSFSYIPTFFWNDELFSLIITLIFKPEVTGFDLQNLEMIESLPSSLKQLSDMFVKKLDDKRLLQLRTLITKEIETKCEDFLDFNQIFNNDRSFTLKNYLNGLIILENFHQFGKLYDRFLNDDETADKLLEIFNLLKTEQYGKAIVVNLESSEREYLENLLEFLLKKCEPKTVTTLVNIVDSKTELTNENLGITTSDGEYFMNLFGDAIVKNLLKNLSQILDTLLSDSLKEKFETVLTMLEDLLSHVKKNRKSSEEFLPNLENEFVQRFSEFRNLMKGIERRKEKLINLYSLLVQVSINPIKICSDRNELYSWIMRELFGYLDLEYKTKLLNNFLPCIVDDNDEHKKQELKNCLHKLKSDYHPINMNDLVKGSLEHSNLISSFQTLVRYLPILKSTVLFDCVIHLTMGNIEYFWGDGSSEYLISYFNEICTNDGERSLQILYKYFINTENFKTRLEILNKLLLKCIHYCNTMIIEHFFEENIKQIYDIVSQDLSGDGSSSKNLIVSKIGCYNLLEIMFAKVSFEKLNSADSKIVRNAIERIETGKELFQGLNQNVLNVRKLKSDNTESKELIRLLHCAAYNCSIAIVSLKFDERFYVLPFAENRKEGQLIWENIIDSNKTYEFKQDFKEMPKEYKKLINIRKQSDLKEIQNHSNVKSYNLAASTLNEDLSCFDLYEANLRPHSNEQNISNKEEMMCLTFEHDDLNNHECMAPICGVITHMVSRSIFNLPDNDGENSAMPKWMKIFHSSLNSSTLYNVKFFIIKVIVNVQEAFKPYAKSFLTPILNFLKLHFRNHRHLNYVIKDILIMLIDWRSVAVPCDNIDKQLAQSLLEMLMNNADSQKRHIYKYNVEIINMLVEAWKSCLKVPKGILNINNASIKFTVRMILIFLSNDMEEQLSSRREVLEYLIELFDNQDEEIVLHVCNAFGMILNFLESKNDDEKKQGIIHNIEKSVIDKSQINENKYIKCIHEIHRFYPNIVNHCFKHLTTNYYKIDNTNKEKCLEIFLSAVPKFSHKEIITELGFIKFQDILINKISSPSQHVALRIIRKLLNILEPNEFLEFAFLTVPYSRDISSTLREIVTDIFIDVYKKYGDNIEDDISVDKLRDLSKRILLSGLLDSNESLQKKLFNFWTEDCNMTEKSIERISEIFDMYNAEIESNYLSILPLMMLNLVSKDPEFKKKMFDQPLITCKFENYQVAILLRSKNAGLAAPMFTSSFATQMSQYYSKSNPTFVRFNQSLNQSLFLRASQSLQFQQTLYKDAGSSHRTVSNEFNNPIMKDNEKISQPSKNIKSKRILQSTADLQESMRRKQISINLRTDEILKEELHRQRNSVKIYRKYRIGDFPDIEIPHSSLIEPLQELVKNDEIIARDLTVGIFCSMLNEMSGNQRKEFLEKIATSLNFILNKTQGSKPLIATVLEMILNSYEIRITPNVIAKVSKSCGLLSLGALLLEEKMISGYTTIENSDEPVAKKFKHETETINGEEDDWLQLANIYKSMNDFDIVQSIFGGERFGKELQEASFAQAASQWCVAKIAYEAAYEMNEGLVKDYCQESLFTCLAHLSEWKKINNHIESELNENFDALWMKPMNENLIIPWALEGQIHGIVQNDCSDGFLRSLNACVNDKEKLTQLRSLYGEEIAIFYINQNTQFSENCLTNGLEKIREEWKHLNPLYYEQKINKYIKLRGLNDIKIYLEGTKDKNQLLENTKCLISFWNDSVPENQDNLLLWDKHIAYRLYFLGLLTQQQKLNAEIISKINDSIVKQCLNIAEVAFGQSNSQFMRKYLRYSEQYLEDDDNDGILNIEWRLAFAKYKYSLYTDSKIQEKRIKHYISSWGDSHKILSNDSLDIKVKMDVRKHISNLVIEIQKLLIKSDPIGNILLADPSISQYLPLGQDQETILKQLNDYCLTGLKECCGTADSTNKADCYLKISIYCHSLIPSFRTELNLSQEFIHSTLTAMRYGSLAATQYFPSLLHLEYSDDPSLEETFKDASKNVETWMFLKWQAQLFSHIGTPASSVISSILFRLAETYPNSIVYTIRMTKEMNKSLQNHPLIVKLTSILSENKDLELFLEALKYLVQPELFLKYHISGLEVNTLMDVNDAVNNLLRIVYPSTGSEEGSLVQGRVYRIIKKFEEKIKEMKRMESGEMMLRKKQIINGLDESLKNRMKDICKVSLKDYSPWLYNLGGGSIEVPGQYVADKKPLPRYHAKIVKIDSKVTVLQSLRKPMKITMLGNDGRNYSFLVKFGEDLRTDERIEQLFMIMNKILQGDKVCRERQLSIDSYLVIPITCSLGLIQWVEKTRSLNEIINSVLTDEQKNERENIIGLFISWMSNNIASGEPIEAIYNKSIMRYGREEVTRKFDQLKNRMDWDILRKAFKNLSVSAESFFALRHNFVTSYATISIAQWILGIGDRNLSNTLISYESGKALGIDFGYSFDAAIDSSVPELMPFRLTPQILGLLKPFDENGLLKVTMINVLRAIKRGKDPLLACMDIFVKEPSLDWLPRKKVLDDRQESSDVKWYPKKKIDIVIDKLNGTKPSELTLLQLKDRYGETECFSKYIDIVNGSDDGLQLKARSKRQDKNLTIEEQVECLLDQATDPNILIRTWFGWEPWI